MGMFDLKLVDDLGGLIKTIEENVTSEDLIGLIYNNLGLNTRDNRLLVYYKQSPMMDLRSGRLLLFRTDTKLELYQRIQYGVMLHGIFKDTIGSTSDEWVPEIKLELDHTLTPIEVVSLLENLIEGSYVVSDPLTLGVIIKPLLRENFRNRIAEMYKDVVDLEKIQISKLVEYEKNVLDNIIESVATYNQMEYVQFDLR